jgi:hypothetical protein
LALSKEEATTTSSSQLISSNSFPYLCRGPSENNDDPVQNKYLAPLYSDDLAYTIDQSDERRLFSERQGECFVESKISESGVFWIKPYLDRYDQWSLSDCIEKALKTTFTKPYSKNRLRPVNNTKCFIYERNKTGKFNRDYIYRRGLVENVLINEKRIDVRLLDKGTLVRFDYNSVFPYIQLDPRSNGIGIIASKHLAIRCCLSSREDERLSHELRVLFSKIVYPGVLRFELVEQVSIGNLQCWYTKLFPKNKESSLNGKCLNDLLAEKTEQQLIDIIRGQVSKNENKKTRSSKSNVDANENKTDAVVYSSLPLNANILDSEVTNKTTHNEASSDISPNKNKSKLRKEKKNKRKSNENTPEYQRTFSRQRDEDKKRTNSLNENQVSTSSMPQNVANNMAQNLFVANTGCTPRVSSGNNTQNRKNNERFQSGTMRQNGRQQDNFKNVIMQRQSNAQQSFLSSNRKH